MSEFEKTMETHLHYCFICNEPIICHPVRRWGSDLNCVGYDDVYHYINNGGAFRFECGCPDNKHVYCKIHSKDREVLKYKIGTDIDGECCAIRFFCVKHTPREFTKLGKRRWKQVTAHFSMDNSGYMLNGKPLWVKQRKRK